VLVITETAGSKAEMPDLLMQSENKSLDRIVRVTFASKLLCDSIDAASGSILKQDVLTCEAEQISS